MIVIVGEFPSSGAKEETKRFANVIERTSFKCGGDIKRNRELYSVCTLCVRRIYSLYKK